MHISSGSLEPRDREALRLVENQLHQSWETGDEPDLKALVQQVRPPLRAAFLLELIQWDLEIRTRRGRSVQLEEYLRKLPELGPAESLPVEVIYQEYRVRHHAGDRPALASYQGRFPRQFADLKRLIGQRPVGTLGAGEDGTEYPIPLSQRPTEPAPDEPVVAASPPLSELLPGGGGYTLTQYIDKGEYGEVYRALAPGGVEVAVKRIFRPSSHAATQRERNALEAIKSLRHPFLLQTHAYWVEDDRLCIVMELAEGSLFDRFKECRAQGLLGIPRAELLDYFADAAEALDFLHSQQVIHRDIKPTNLLRLQGRAKVGDFGLARLFRSEQELTTATLCGTPLYMAPEVWRNQASPQSDQYSLAAAFLEMCVGQQLVPGPSVAGNVTPLDGFNKAEQQVLRKALAATPKERYPNCSSFVRALVEAGLPSPVPRRSSRWAWVVSMLLAVGLVGATAWGILNRRPEGPAANAWLQRAGFESIEDGSDPGLPRRIRSRRLRGCEPIEFLLILRTDTDDLPPFYAMRDKVTNEQFQAGLLDPGMQALLAEWGGICPEAIQNKWRLPAFPCGSVGLAAEPSGSGLLSVAAVLVAGRNHDSGREARSAPENARKPVFSVTAVEGHCFAVLLGGNCRAESNGTRPGDDSRALWDPSNPDGGGRIDPSANRPRWGKKPWTRAGSAVVEWPPTGGSLPRTFR